jgi:hypothetical protein
VEQVRVRSSSCDMGAPGPKGIACRQDDPNLDVGHHQARCPDLVESAL